MTPAEAARYASRIAGGQAELARALKLSPPTISQWCSGVRPVPAARAIQIHELTAGEVLAADLCPAFPWGCSLRSNPTEYKGVFAEEKASPTLNTNLRPISPFDQTGKPSVRPSSTGGVL